MQLSYTTETVRRQIVDPRGDDWPSEAYREDVRQQVADLIAAESLLEVPVGVPDLARANPGGFELLAGSTVILSCRVNHYAFPVNTSGQPAWSQINRIMIKKWQEAANVDADKH